MEDDYKGIFGDYERLLREIFLSPMDSFDFYLNSGKFSLTHLFTVHILLWTLCPLSILIQKVSVLLMNFRIKEEIVDAWAWKDYSVFLIYPAVMVLASVLEGFRNGYNETRQKTAAKEKNLVFLSFLPFSATGIFWILPKPFPFFFLAFAMYYSFRILSKTLKNLSGYTDQEYRTYLMYILILFSVLSLGAASILKTVR